MVSKTKQGDKKSTYRDEYSDVEDKQPDLPAPATLARNTLSSEFQLL